MCGQGRKFSFTQEAADADTDAGRSLRLGKEQGCFFFLATVVVRFEMELRCGHK